MLKLKEYMDHQGHASCLNGVFGMVAGTSDYGATLFRFPLRQENSKSKISQNCYTPAKVHANLFSSLQTEAPILLLFLKHVLKVSMYKWNEESNGPECTFSVEISDNVKRDRLKCTSLAQAYTQSSSKVRVVVTSATTTCRVHEEKPSKRIDHWLMLNSIGSDLEELRTQAAKMKVLPWVGIAAQAPTNFNLTDLTVFSELKPAMSVLDNLLLKHTCEASGFAATSTAGQAFCFLPLPGSISLPVNIHGYFSVADNRRSIKWPSHDEKGEEAKWNEILLHKLISPLYALLLACRSSLIRYHKTFTNAPINNAYAAWPVYAEVKNRQIWSELLEPVLKQIVNLPVLWSEACSGTWVTPKEAFFINPEEMCPQVALKVLVDLGYKVVSLPPEILETMLAFRDMQTIIATRYVTADLLRNAMRNKKGVLHSYSKEDVYQCLEYVVSHQPPCHTLIGLEVLPLCDDTLCEFGSGNSAFLFPEKYRDCLKFLPGIATVVVDTKVPFGLQEKLEALSRQGQLQMRLVTPNIVCQLIKLSMKSWYPSLCTECIWQPGHYDHPPVDWITNVWSWIRTSQTVYQVSSIPLVPTEDVTSSTKQVRLLPLNARPNLCTIPFEKLPSQCLPDVMLEVVKLVGLVHVHQSNYISQCPGTEQYIKCFDARLLLQHVKPSISNKLTTTHKDCLRYFIACNLCASQLSSEESCTIKSLPIFRAGVGASESQYISLNQLNCVLPPRGIVFNSDIEYPPNILCDEDIRVTALLQTLNVKRSSTIDAFCTNVVIPFVLQKAKWSYNDEKLIMWVLQCPLTNPKFLQHYEIIKPCISGHKRMMPSELYDPNDDVFCKLFDSQTEAAFPADEYKHVLPILRHAGLITWSNLRNNSKEMVAFLVGRARSVSQLSKSNGLARSKSLLSLILKMGLIQHSQLSQIKFLLPQDIPPANYPHGLTWYGERKPQATSPQDICCNISEAFLVGSVLPVLSSEYEIYVRHTGFHQITSENIVSHLKQVILYVSTRSNEMTESDGNQVHSMVMNIYRSLFTQKTLVDFPKKWIWWRNIKQFLSPKQCVFTLPLEVVTLEPHLYCLSTNPELQACVSSMLPMLPQVQLKRSLQKADAVAVLEEMNQPKGKFLTPQQVNMAIQVLQWLKNHDHHTHGHMLIPTSMSTLALVSECTYDDRNWKKTSVVQTSKYTFVHEDISPALAKYLHVVPLSQKVAPSKMLKVKYTKTGQREPITRRIKQIVEDYATSSDILKELLQNADDARATEVKILIDWRQHPCSSLLADELKHWQGPALVAYNNSVFSDQDFEHICELAAETKMEDPLKTGRFGVGFCATYRITDIPSFVSRKQFTMFDPHTTYLGERVSEAEPGMRIDLVENKDDLTVYADQFQPYDGLFGCDIFNLPAEGFQGTLFRFPFRSPKTANESRICKNVPDASITKLVHDFQEQALLILLFLKHVCKISMFVIQRGAKSVNEMEKILEVEKTCQCSPTCNRLNLISSGSQNTVTYKCHCTIKCVPKQLQCRDTSHWIICSALTPKVKTLSRYGGGETQHGLVSFAEVAFKVQKNDNGTLSPVQVEGYTFCFLPLPMKTELFFHVNGFFDISHDRSGLKCSDDERFGKEWNEHLCKEPLMQAYFTALSELASGSPLQQVTDTEDRKKYLKAYYQMFRLSDKNIIGQNMSSSVKEGLPVSEYRLFWSDANGGRWLRPRDVVLLILAESVKKMCQSMIDVLLKLGYNVCEVPQHVEKLIDFLKRTSTTQVYNCQTFYAKVLMPNICQIPTELRDKHIRFLLESLRQFKWISSLLMKQPCIPIRACTHLALPSDLIDYREPLLMCLYDEEEGRFPADCLKDDHIMLSLKRLGMKEDLQISDIKNRACTVKTLHLNDKEKAAERSWTLLKYVQKRYHNVRYSYHSVSRHEELSAALSKVPFIPVAQKPPGLIPWCENDNLLEPCEVFTPKCNNLIFSKRPVVVQPKKYELHPDILVLIGASCDPPLQLVISHVLNLSKASKTFNEDALPFITEVMMVIYKYLKFKLSYRYYDESQEEVTLAKQELQQAEFIWQQNKFLRSEQVVLEWTHKCFPYLCELSSENKKYQELFVELGVQEQPSVDDLARILQTIANRHNSGVEKTDVVQTSKVSQLELEFIEEVVKRLSELVKKKVAERPVDLYLPDEACIMRPVKQLACDNIQTDKDDKDDWVKGLQMFRSQFEEGVCHFIHPSIPRQRAITLGVKPLLHALVQGWEDENFMKGIGYGQHEDLCDRLQSILAKYPADHSILNEFIQNADDAQATEIVFVLDHRKFSQNKIFPSNHTSWKELQHTPALCVINNRKFTEDDIEGIAQLGRGGKRDSSDKIGRFGIGFNVAYHITDCPSFISFSEKEEPENFCVLDPTCSFAPNTNKQNPGKRWILDPQKVKDLPEQIEPYLLKEIPNALLEDLAKGHVVFRLPLTRNKPVSGVYYGYPNVKATTDPKRTRLSNAFFDPERISCIFKEMETYARDTLLFLNHVVKISAFEIKEKGEIKMYFSTRSTMPREDTTKCHKFARDVKEITEGRRALTDLESTNKINVSHKVPDKPLETVQWLVCRHYSPTKIIQDKSDSDASKSSTVEWNMKPLGGIAAAIGKVNVRGRFFCFLPMPLESKFPVHVNGHFLVDDSRKHLETLKRGHFNWNMSLAANVIAPCYVDILLHAHQMTKRGETDPKWFYSLFPSLSSEGEIGNLKLADSVYKILLERNPPILLQRHPDTDAVKWFTLKGRDMGYFFREFMSEVSKKKVTADPVLQCALVKLELPIVTDEVPHKLYRHWSTVDSTYLVLARVDPQKIIEHFMHNVYLSDMQVILKIEVLELLLQFLIDGMSVDDLKESLEAVPLLLSLNNCLWKGKSIYKSAHASLLPHCSAHFIHEELEESSVGKILAGESYKLIVDLPITFVVEHVDICDSTQPIKISDVSPEAMHTIKNLWTYVKSSPLLLLSGAIGLFPNKPLLPTDDGYLYPVYLSDAILCSENGNRHVLVRNCLKKLGYPTISFDAMQISEPYGNLGNMCLGGEDIVNCFKTKAPPIEDADLSAEEVRSIIDLLRNQHLGHITGILQRLKIFVMVDGTFTSMKGNRCVCVMPRDVPKDGIECIQQKFKADHVILKGTDKFTMNFYWAVLPNISTMYVPGFYKKFILPCMQELHEDALQTHLRHIRFDKNLKRDRLLMSELKQVKFIELDDGTHPITEVCDPNNTFYNTFCSTRCLPNPWKSAQEEWLPFFKELGLKHKVSFEEWMSHAKSFAADHQQDACDSEVHHESRILLDTLFKLIEEGSFCNIQLEEAGRIEFICNSSPSVLINLLCDIFENPQTLQKSDLFCFRDSVMNRDNNLAALCRRILPECCDEKLQKRSDICSLLGIESPVKATTIERNLKELSKLYTCLQRPQPSHNNAQLRKILVSHYAALNTFGDFSDIDFDSLKETLCIVANVDPQGRSHQNLVLIKPTQLVMTIPSDINLEPFCYEVPPELRPFTHFLSALGVPQEVSATKCADILQTIYQQLQQVSGKLLSTDKFKRVALSAYNHMVCSLRKQVEDLPNTIYLPSEDDELVSNDKLLYNDAMWYAQRLPQNQVFPFLKFPQPDDKGEKVPPASLRVTWLTSVVSEELHDDMLSSDYSCTEEEQHDRNKCYPRCHFVKKVYDTMMSPQLKEGVRRVCFSECKEKPSEELEESLKMLARLQIRCVTSPTIVTVLKRNNTVIPNSECRDKYCHASVKNNQLFIAPHGNFNQLDFMQSLSSALKVLLRNEIKNEAYLMAMLGCEPSEIEAELDKYKVSRYDPTSIKETKYLQVGDKISLQNFTLEHCLIVLNFSVGELVYYFHSDTDGEIQVTTAEVIAVGNFDNFCENYVTLKVSLNDEDSELDESVGERVIQVSPFQVFKILTPSQQILLFSSLSDSLSVRATAEPVHIATIPAEEDKITDVLCSLFGHEYEPTDPIIAMGILRLISHIHYVLAKEESPPMYLLNEKVAANFLSDLKLFLESCDYTDVAHHILEIAGNLHVHVCGPYRYVPPTCNTGLSYISTGLSLLSLQQTHQPPTYTTHHQPRFQPQQRRGYHHQQAHHYRYQPQEVHTQPPPPPVSVEKAQMWLDQAKVDYRAAFFLMGAATITPTIVSPPQMCEVNLPEDSEPEDSEPGSDSGEVESAVSIKQEVVGMDDEMSSDNEDSLVEGDDEELQPEEQSARGPHFPALVCFLCHEAVEKCIKGVMYAYTGLKPSLIQCSTLVTLYEDLHTSPHRPMTIMEPIQQCVMQINEHENMSRFPNFQIPPCAPAAVYTAVNANEAILATRQLFENLQRDEHLAAMMGDLGELPKPQFTSMLRSLGGNDGM